MTGYKMSLLTGLLMAGFACKADSLFMGEDPVDGGDRPDLNTGGSAGIPGLGGSGGILGYGGSAAGGATTVPLYCGNGVIDGNEQCDDGNTVSGDGCSRSCQVEASCSCPAPGQPCTCNSLCGNGIVTANENCDDGNMVSGDGCSADCQTVELGWSCRVPGKRCTPLCGDGVVVEGETCDDGNSNSGDGCSSTCQLEPGASCPAPGQPC